ncbi:MAG: NusG domain II-containing protein [Clostridia bacterium]|nr:NusG domain II-containing protein [Clostridia bacterium]
MERKLITKTDLLIIAAVVVLIVISFVVKNFSGENLVAEIYFDGKVIESVNLSQKEEKEIVTGSNGETVIKAKDGKIFFTSSCCPDKVCVKSGKLEKNGDFASCLPEKVVVKVRGEKNDNIDAIVY